MKKYVDVDIMTDILDPWDDGDHSAGSTDVSDVSWITPTMEFNTACNVNGAPGHSWQFTACSGSGIGHKSLIFASKTMAGAALDLMMNPDKIKKAKDELASRLDGRVYARDPTREPPLEKARELAETYKGNVD